MNVITAPSVVAATTTSLVRVRVGNGGGVSNGDGNDGQEDSSSTSVGNDYSKSVTNLFVKEEEGLLGSCHNYACTVWFEKDCNAQGGCYWYQHLKVHSGRGLCSSCSGVWCGGHRATVCSFCSTL